MNWKMDKPDLIPNAHLLTAAEEVALDEFTLKANQWRLTEDSINLMHQLATSSSTSSSHSDSEVLVDSISSSSHKHVAIPNPGVISKSIALKFLMARKFDVQRALDLYRQYQIVRHSEGLNNLDPTSDPFHTELRSGKFTVLESKDRNGATIALLTGRLHNSDKAIKATKERCITLQNILFQLDVAVSNRETQRNGLLLLYDMSGVRWANSDLTLARHLLDILKGGFPARLKKILIVDAPSWLQVPFRIIRPFMTAKMLERLYVIPSMQLVDHIPLEAVPESLGGHYKHDHDKWLQVCLLRSEQEDGICRRDSNSFPPPPSVPPLPTWIGHNISPFSASSHPEKNDCNSGDNERGLSLEESKIGMNVSVHRRTDKGMGVVEFVRLIRSMGKDGILREYDALRSVARALPDKQFLTFKLPENRVKNRYIDVPCFEASRVKLQRSPSGDDYIHANFVDGYEQKNAFISTQGPMPKTFADFWLMVWEQECRVLVMTTRTVERGKQKCGQYWPAQSNDNMDVGDFVITNNTVSPHAHYVQTHLTLTCKKNEEERRLVHLQFTDWPDYGVPHSAASMFEFIGIMRHLQATMVKSMKPWWTGQGNGPPIIVHCSAGIGRSGSLCALDICIERLNDCGLVDVHQTVQKLRSQRCQSIQMPEQYLFSYLALVEYAVGRGLISKEEADLPSLLVWLNEDDQ